MVLTGTAVVIVVPVTWMRCWKRQFGLRTTSTFSICTARVPPGRNDVFNPDYSTSTDTATSGDCVEAPDTTALAAGEKDDIAYIVARERVESLPLDIRQIKADYHRDSSRPLPSSATPSTTSSSPSSQRILSDILDLDALINAYLRKTMTMFAVYTPQAYVMRLHPSVRRHHPARHQVAARDTFERGYLSTCDFVPSDRVCGVYVVEERRRRSGGVEVILRISLPSGGEMRDAPSGVLRLSVKEALGSDSGSGKDTTRKIQFINETVLWREGESKPVFLESGFGRWVHGLMAAWLVVRGSETVMVEQSA